MRGSYKEGKYTFVLDPIEVLALNALMGHGIGSRKGCKDPNCKDCNMARQMANTLEDAEEHVKNHHLEDILKSRL